MTVQLIIVHDRARARGSAGGLRGLAYVGRVLPQVHRRGVRRELLVASSIAHLTQADWEALAVATYGTTRTCRRFRRRVLISYINNSTSSIHPIVNRVEILRREGKIGRVYYPAPYMTNENLSTTRTHTRRPGEDQWHHAVATLSTWIGLSRCSYPTR